MTRRPGLTMTEVLVALFIMALGTIAILTMFPLGMLNMGQALKDDRTAQAASAADGFMRWYWKTYVVEPPPTAQDPFYYAMDNPDARSDPAVPGFVKVAYPSNLPTALPGEPSYPLFVDPIGYYLRGGRPEQWWVGGAMGNQTIPRRTLDLIDRAGNPPGTDAAKMATRTCTLLDGLTYNSDGLPASNGPYTAERDMRYNWLWVLQKPVTRDRNTVRMTVVVFDRRGSYATDETPFPNAVSTAKVPLRPNATALVLPATSGVQKGSWIMDATPQDTGLPTPLPTPVWLRHANFYRVVSVTDASPGNVNVELETPIKRSDGGSTAYPGTVIVLAGVSEVFSRPNLTTTQ
ncbi:MAG TPA: prepilin-type N-terminal cleavage/methylation domain-containing protein [Gemmataceae bacterium]|nr:prepilin-type N-terminal cleavage/methylation domain-containing protein [Gemmataceae bacterium]